jgi:hypothetical protein
VWRYYTYNCWLCIHNLLSCPTSLPLHVSAVHGHHQVHVYLAKTVPLCVNITYRVWTRCWLLIKLYCHVFRGVTRDVVAHLYTRLGTTSSYSTTAEFHTYKSLHAKSSQFAFTVRHLSSIVACVFTEPLLRNDRLFICLLHTNCCTHCLFRGPCLATVLYARIFRIRIRTS